MTACDDDDMLLDCPEPVVEAELADTPLPVERKEAPTTADACEAEPWTACDGEDDVLMGCPEPTVGVELADRLLPIELDEPSAMVDS